MNRHVRTFHPTHKHLDIVYRACLLEDQPTNPRAYVLTHRERYECCEGTGLPIEAIHTLEADFTGFPAAKRQCVRIQALPGTETAAVLAQAATSEARPGAEAGKATAQTATGEARPGAEACKATAQAATGEARQGAEACKATAQTATGEARPGSEAGMPGAREDANIRWALDRGHGVEVHAITIKFTPGNT